MAGFTFEQTQSGNLTLLVSGGFLFGGLMFGPDLDIYSKQYQRWGWLRWIWLPYQKSLRHRSFLSHGPIVGTTLRLLYLAAWLGIVGILILKIAQVGWGVGWSWRPTVQFLRASITHYSAEWIALYLGLELGAVSHIVSDWGGSTYKRLRKQGWSALLLPATKKRKSTRVIRRPKPAVKRKNQ